MFGGRWLRWWLMVTCGVTPLSWKDQVVCWVRAVHNQYDAGVHSSITLSLEQQICRAAFAVLVSEYSKRDGYQKAQVLWDLPVTLQYPQRWYSQKHQRGQWRGLEGLKNTVVVTVREVRIISSPFQQNPQPYAILVINWKSLSLAAAVIEDWHEMSRRNQEVKKV